MPFEQERHHQLGSLQVQFLRGKTETELPIQCEPILSKDQIYFKGDLVLLF